MYYMKTSKKPSPQAIQNLLQIYPKLDHLIAETILSFTEEELGKFLEEKKSGTTSIDDDDKIGESK